MWREAAPANWSAVEIVLGVVTGTLRKDTPECQRANQETAAHSVSPPSRDPSSNSSLVNSEPPAGSDIPPPQRSPAPRDAEGSEPQVAHQGRLRSESTPIQPSFSTERRLSVTMNTYRARAATSEQGDPLFANSQDRAMACGRLRNTIEISSTQRDVPYTERGPPRAQTNSDQSR
ncbi:hypothetical protein DL769_005665 [Monosporascus sp. CRB-8-3]|nr:hypothetical protein DL769_005665 [Monosporascus sp. CRB-8-3]